MIRLLLVAKGLNGGPCSPREWPRRTCLPTRAECRIDNAISKTAPLRPAALFNSRRLGIDAKAPHTLVCIQIICLVALLVKPRIFAAGGMPRSSAQGRGFVNEVAAILVPDIHHPAPRAAVPTAWISASAASVNARMRQGQLSSPSYRQTKAPMMQRLLSISSMSPPIFSA
jgi:hypothetical protein